MERHTKFVKEIRKKYPDITPCAAVGLGYDPDVEECIDCVEEYPDYNEECKEFTEIMIDLRDKGELKTPKPPKEIYNS